jgi:hypothetical protein
LRWQKEKEKVMDYNALQHKLFAMDPTDPAEDLAKLRAQAGGNAPAPAPQVDYIAESAAVPEGSLQMDRDYSINDFAALAGVVTEKQKLGSAGQAKGKDPMPSTSKPSTSGEQPHPLKDKLVGEASPDEEDKFHTDLDDLVHKTFGHSSDEEKSDKDRIAELEKRVEALEAQLSERTLTKGEEKKKEKYVKGMKKNKDDFQKRYGKDAKSVMYATATKMAKESSVDSIKDQLYAALNSKMSD